MSESHSSRRSFLKTAIVGAAAVGASPLVSSGKNPPAAQANQVVKRKLGKTAKDVSILGLGLGSAFTRPYDKKRDEAARLLEQALDLGVNYWDTSRGCGNSEEITGPVVAKRRNEIFLVTKSGSRDYDGFMRDVDTSLKKLQTDRLDLLHIWNLKRQEVQRLDRIEKGAFKAVQKLIDEKVVPHFGVTGHSGPDVLMACIKRFNPDAVLSVFPCTRPQQGRYEDELLPMANKRKMGVIAMKAVRQARNADLKGSDLIRYALSLQGVCTAIVGLDTLAHLKENCQMATNFKAMDKDEMAALSLDAQKYLADDVPVWEKPGYQDGMWA